MEKSKELPSQEKQNAKLSAAIMHAVDVKAAFEMYAYRILDHDQFIARISELNQFLTKQLKK